MIKVAALIFAMIFAGCLMVITGRTDVKPLALQVVDRFAPGNPKPDDSYCSFQYYYYTDHLVDCEGFGDEGRILFTYDYDNKVIVRTSYMTLGDFNLGQLILAWGEPLGQDTSSYSMTIYWSNGRQAYIMNHGFSPTSSVGYVAFDNRPNAPSPWRGFRVKY